MLRDFVLHVLFDVSFLTNTHTYSRETKRLMFVVLSFFVFKSLKKKNMSCEISCCMTKIFHGNSMS